MSIDLEAVYIDVDNSTNMLGSSVQSVLWNAIDVTLWNSTQKILTICSNRKCQDYVYVKWEYWSTILKTKHYLRHENKANKNKVLSHCEALRCETIKTTKQLFPLCQT